MGLIGTFSVAGKGVSSAAAPLPLGHSHPAMLGPCDVGGLRLRPLHRGPDCILTAAETMKEFEGGVGRLRKATGLRSVLHALGSVPGTTYRHQHAAGQARGHRAPLLWGPQPHLSAPGRLRPPQLAEAWPSPPEHVSSSESCGSPPPMGCSRLSAQGETQVLPRTESRPAPRMHG